MILFTSNYARHGSDPNAVSISLKPPPWFSGRQYLKLAPSWDIVRAIKRKEITVAEYTAEYIRLLDQRKLDPQKVLYDLSDGAIMLCYESPDQFCHRQIAAVWIQERTGIEVHERYYYDIAQSDPVDKLFDN